MLYPAATPTSTRDAIISVLGEQWPLSAKKLYNEVRRRGVCVTYQAVHKTVKWLIVQGVVLKGESGYVLDRGWVSKLRSFGEQIEQRYAAAGDITAERLLKSEGQTFTVRFETVFECYRFLLQTIGEYAHEKSVSLQTAALRHLWWILAGSPKEHRHLQSIFHAAPLCISVAHGSFGDTLLQRFYEAAGVAVRFAGGSLPGSDMYATDGLVIEIYYPNEIIEAFDTAYQDQERMLNGLPDFYQSLLFAHCAIDVVLICNTELAKQKIESVRSRFPRIEKRKNIL